jgi:hypothetical protein
LDLPAHRAPRSVTRVFVPLRLPRRSVGRDGCAIVADNCRCADKCGKVRLSAVKNGGGRGCQNAGLLPPLSRRAQHEGGCLPGTPNSQLRACRAHHSSLITCHSRMGGLPVGNPAKSNQIKPNQAFEVSLLPIITEKTASPHINFHLPLFLLFKKLRLAAS